MMKKFHYFLMVLLLALVAVGVTSCGDDDEPKYSSDIIGTWALDNTGYGAAVILFQFTKDGTFHEVNISMLNGETGVDVFHGTYTVSGNKLTVTYIFEFETEKVECTYHVKGDKLRLNFEDEGEEGFVTFTRVNDSVIEPYL